MNLPENLARAFDRLCAHYDRADEIRGQHVRSLQAPFEAQMEAKAMAQRHQGVRIAVRTEHGIRIERRRGTDLACGCTAHCYHPAPQGGRDYDGPDVQLDARPDPLATALRRLDSIQTVRLERLARVPLPKHLYIFGAPFKGEEDHRALQRAPLIGVAQEVEHGPGTIADLSDTAVRLWGLHAREEVVQLGRRIAARKAEAADRELARAIRREDEEMARRALTALDDALHPLAMARANERACGGVARHCAALRNELSPTLRRTGAPSRCPAPMRAPAPRQSATKSVT